MKNQVQASTRSIHKSPKVASAILCLLAALAATTARGIVGIDYWDPTGASPSPTPNGTWEGNVWSTSVNLTASPVAFTEGNFAAFAAGSVATGPYTVTADAGHTIAGIFNGGPFGIPPGSVTINGPGILTLANGIDSFSTASTGNTTINAVLAGAGELEAEQFGSLYLYGNNTYSGGTLLNQTIIYFNNNNSFGSGTINTSAGGTGYSALASSGGSTITLPNNFAVTTAGTGVNFVNGANTPVISSGNWNLAKTLLLGNNGNSTAPLTLSGLLSGAGGLTVSGANAGTINLTAVNSYAGVTTVGVMGETAITLQLGAVNAIGASLGLTLSGGTFSPGGFNQNMASAPLTLMASSTIDYGAGASTVKLANSSAASWTGDLNLANWNPSVDTLQIGTDATGLTPAQLADITFNGGLAGMAEILPNGDIEQVPEPSTIMLAWAGGLGMIWNIRRRMA